MRKFASAAVLFAFALSLNAAPLTTFAQQSAGSATLEIQQENAAGVLGRWTLLMPGDVQKTGEGPAETLAELVTGTYTIIAEAPDGANTTIRRYLDTSLLETVTRGQMTFMVQENEKIKLSIHYTFIRIGTVAIHSDPAGVTFELTGPNDMAIAGITPTTLDDVPEGQYAVQYGTLPGCNTPPRQAHMLEERSRITFDVTLSCKSADKIREREDDEPSEEQFVTVTIDGREITMRDVPQNTWFAPFVFRAAKLNVVAGYRDENGVPTGEFGPDKYVSLAELAAMAQRAAGLQATDNDIPPENEAARGTWAAPFIAYAEQHGWTVYSDTTINPERAATRGEVMVTLLQAFDVPVRWAKGSMFTDVQLRTMYASAIETAAGDGIVGGYIDENGELTGAFGPADPVTRAQVAKILVTGIDTYRLDGAAEEE